MAKLGIDKQSYTGFKSSLGLDDTYEETFRYVQKSIVNEDDYQVKTSIGGSIVLILISILIEIFAECTFYDFDFNDDDLPALITAITGIIDNIIRINNDKKDIKKYNKDIAILDEKCKKIILENKDLIKNLLTYYENIKNNPEYNKETKKIEKTLRLVKEKENN